jgi:hypothetical protein
VRVRYPGTLALPVTVPPGPFQAAHCFNKLKQYRAVATRYDKRELIYQGTIDVASTRIWLRDPIR